MADRSESRKKGLCVLVSVALAVVSAACGEDGEMDGGEPSVETTGGALTASGQATLEDYWEGNARWELVRSQPHHSGVHIEVVDGVWYKFYRKVNRDSQDNFIDADTAVQMSTDQGATWSSEVIALDADVLGYSYATDGDTWYDPADGGTWHYLFQCNTGPPNGWQGCYAYRNGSSPMGAFVQISENPVIGPDAQLLWNAICQQGDHCYDLVGGNPVGGAGTFNIFDQDEDWFYVSFHGFDSENNPGSTENGFRGIAVTADFRTYFVDGEQSTPTPSDAYLDRLDQRNDLDPNDEPWDEDWHASGPGPVGFGAGNILEEGAYYYALGEGPDFSLLCEKDPNQRWDLGLFRSDSLTDTDWDPLPAGNPIFYSDDTSPSTCQPEYSRLFKDGDTTYIHMSRQLGIGEFLLYRLVPDSNLLDNGNVWKCEDGLPGNLVWSWTTFGTANVMAKRDAVNSTDFNCYLEFDCGTGSCVGSGVQQDIEDISHLSTPTIHWGGRVRTAMSTGDLSLQLQQLDSSGGLVGVAYINDVSLDTTYRDVRFTNTFTLDSATVALRYVLNPKSSPDLLGG